MSISRLYNFTANTTILSAEVNAELTQLVNEVNTMLKYDGTVSMTGNLTIAKSIPSIIFGGTETSAKNWKLVENAGLFKFQVDSSGYLDFLIADYTNVSFYPGTAAAYDLGKTANPFRSIHLDNGATDSGAVYFDGGTTNFVKAANATDLRIGGFTEFTPSTDGGCALGATSLRWTLLKLKTNLSANSAPVVDTQYANSMCKAWGSSDSSGNRQDGFNASISRTTTGIYVVTFLTNLANADYTPVVTPESSSGVAAVVSASTKAVSGFTIVIRTTDTQIAADKAFSFIVFGKGS